MLIILVNFLKYEPCNESMIRVYWIHCSHKFWLLYNNWTKTHISSWISRLFLIFIEQPICMLLWLQRIRDHGALPCQIVCVPAIGEAEAIDATGAGDLFLYVVVKGLSLEECCNVGACSGGSVIRSLGEVTLDNWQWTYKLISLIVEICSLLCSLPLRVASLPLNQLPVVVSIQSWKYRHFHGNLQVTSTLYLTLIWLQ